MALPTATLEDWRYSRIDSLDLERYQPPGTNRPASGRGDALEPLTGQKPDLAAALVGAAKRYAQSLTTVETTDGRVSFLGEDPHGSVRVTVLSEGSPAARERQVDSEYDAFAVANEAFCVDPILVEVQAAPAESTVLVVHRCNTDGSLLFPRVAVDVAPASRATVIEVVVGEGACLVVPVTQLEVGSSAQLVYLGIQTLADSAWQIASQSSRVAAGGTLISGAIALGGDYARLRTDSQLVGAGASSQLVAMYFASGSQMHDFRTVQDHRAPRTTSELLYKGVVANTARSVYSGLIRVDKGAKGSKAYQTNRNLVLHEGARAESVPNLEIEESDVSCSHASAIGPVSEDEQFYLQSRGVPAEAADRLISVGFLTEALDQLPLGPIGLHVRSALAVKLAEAESIEAERLTASGGPGGKRNAGL